MSHSHFSLVILCCALSTQALAEQRRKAEPEIKRLSPWSVEVSAGAGYDSNAYLAPSEPYFDYAANQPVNPETHSGTFIPLDLRVDYDGRGNGERGVIASYSFSGSLYPESDTDNADEYNHKLKAGMEFLLNREGKREDTFRVTPYLGIHDKTYFNRDTGDSMVSARGTDLSERYSYNVSGIKAEIEHNTARLPHGLHAEVARFDYEEPSAGTFDSYDHDYIKVGGDVTFPLAKPLKLVLSYDYSNRDYDERRARNLNGDRVRGTTREYTYNKIEASLRNRLNKNWIVSLDYGLTDREDDYVGYYDYTQNSYGVSAAYKKGKRIRVKANVEWWQRDYDNAFAFDDPTQPQMTYDAMEVSLKGDYGLGKHHGLWAEYKAWDQESTDQRYDYDRYQAMLGWRWEK